MGWMYPMLLRGLTRVGERIRAARRRQRKVRQSRLLSAFPRAGLKDVLREVGRSLLVLFWLEPHFVPSGRYFEEHLDFVSVQATMYQSGTSWWRRMGRHVQFYAYNDDNS